MALNLSTLTSPATSGDVLAEALTTADFLEGVPVLRNLARGSNKGGDAAQTVSTQQPKALPLTADSNGVVGGYLYQPDVTGNAPAVDIPSIAANEDFVFEMEVYLVDAASFHLASGVNSLHRFAVHNNTFYFSPESVSLSSPLSTGASTLTVERSGTTATLKQDGVVKATLTANIADNDYNLSHLSHNGQFSTSIGRINGYIKKATLSIEGTEVFNCDFTATNVRHNDTKFKCATGQVVTINQDSSSSNDVATVIKKPVLRFDGANSGLDGLFASSIDSGYMFAAFSVLGSGGDTYARVFTTNESGQTDVIDSSWIWSLRDATSSDIGYYNDGIFINSHVDMYNDDRGDYLVEHKVISGSQKSKINNADLKTSARSSSLVLDDYHIGVSEIAGDNNAAIDLEYLALFDASITDAQADAVRNYINNRNTVFDLKDGFGYYFYDAQKAPVGNISSGSASWNGRIVGSDNGDTDKFATQGVSNDQPVSDGYVVTFADNTDHLEIPQVTLAAGDSYAWMVCGTSLGTFAYKVTVSSETELNLLGHLGNASHRKAGDLYGIILLPESATGREINEAKKLLTDRGASVSATADVEEAWRERSDIVQFDGGDMSDVTTVKRAWRSCSSLTSFSTALPSVTNANSAWLNCTSLTSFSSELSSVTTAYGAWQNCSSLTSFSTPLPLATNAVLAWYGCTSLTSFSAELPSVTNANSTWLDCTSLTSFSVELPSVTTANSAWKNCSSLTSFSTELPSVTNLSSAFQDCTQLAEIGQLQTSNVTTWYYSFYNCRSLLSFPVLDTSSGTDFFGTWRNCSGLTQFPLLNCNSGLRFSWTFEGCSSLEDFPAGFFDNWNPSSISEGAFHNTWGGCTSLTAQSVENILTSIDASGKYATSSGASGGSALADAGIDIDYDVSTGSLSAATTAAITSLKSKGWSIFINSVEQ